MGWIERLGQTVSLLVKEPSWEDPFGNPTYIESWVDVDNVVLGNVATSDSIDIVNVTGKRIAYDLCIPKGDTHEWTDTDVIINGRKYRTVGITREFVDPPLYWNKRIVVEAYE